MASVKDLQDFLKNPVEFGIIPFWLLNHYPEEKVLRQQIRDFAAKNVAGVMVHARNGLIGGYTVCLERTMSLVLRKETGKQRVSCVAR